jgi:hypothetical protein
MITMKTFRFVPALLGLLLAAHSAQAQTYAPASLIGNTILNSTLVSSTGGANADGTFSDLFSVNGMDYSVSSTGMLASPATYTYASSGPNTGVITEGALAVTLNFTSVSGGAFVANYGGGVTQTGSFTLTSLGVPTALNSLVQGNSLEDVSDLMHLDAGTATTVGFVIGGTAPVTVLVRAAGPGLNQFGVTGTLATPKVSLLNSQGVVLSSNAGWANSAALQTAFGESGAFNFASGSADSALVMTLAPGAYTAQVRSVSATDSGNVLVEVYIVQ